MGLEDYEVIQVEPQSVTQLDAVEKANVDVQVATAKTFPRIISRIMNNSIALVTMNKETAQSCSYALPRGGKPITGPSVHLARILAQQYGNMRAEAKVVEITDKQIISRAMAWDLESNYAVAFEVRRSIVDKYGRRYNDDMITVTGNAANAIAYRNAVLAIIPKGIMEAAYKAAQDLITGDLSDEAKLVVRRKKALDFFNDEYGISESEVLKMLGKQTIQQIKAEQIALMLSTQQALKDGDTTVDELMKDIRSHEPTIQEKKEALKGKAKGGIEQPTLL